MSERESFIERWSRLKREAAAQPAAPERSEPDAGAAHGEPEPDAMRPARGDEAGGARAQPAPDEAFDIGKLPPIESITAETDIRAFLAPGVPAQLRHMALRRAWTTDPAIRDYVGLSENAWDFTDPTAMEGFGELPSATNVKNLVAQLFGDATESEAAAQSQSAGDQPQCDSDHAAATTESMPAETHQISENRAVAAATAQPPQGDDAELVRSNHVAAVQDNRTAVPENSRRGRRGHGSALPK